MAPGAAAAGRYFLQGPEGTLQRVRGLKPVERSRGETPGEVEGTPDPLAQGGGEVPEAAA